MKFERVIVVADGRIVQDGSPHELAATEGAFATLLADEHRLREEVWEHPDWRHLEIASQQVRTRRSTSSPRGKQ